MAISLVYLIWLTIYNIYINSHIQNTQCKWLSIHIFRIIGCQLNFRDRHLGVQGMGFLALKKPQHLKVLCCNTYLPILGILFDNIHLLSLIYCILV